MERAKLRILLLKHYGNFFVFKFTGLFKDFIEIFFLLFYSLYPLDPDPNVTECRLLIYPDLNVCEGLSHNFPFL